ncbi:MAG: NAD-dependent DNA ligase LigA [Atribacterota bacterium]|nr:NAD-dependent DNA ligase LigA [Atribacterota bacterium]MDD4896273.1 NAD-dependent DNA ligase LigA [Atribacterota bacterium]MDD5636364.1 NAD-dependent DNA ligase LigA [Atribacterota bacterium]
MFEKKNKIKIKEEIEWLREEIRKHNYHYYVDDQPLISDYEYDLLMKQLVELERDYPEFIAPDSPTQRVGAKPLEQFITARHLIPMLSLSNAFYEQELIDFDQRVRKNFPHQYYDYVVELKIDGLAIALVYEKGILTRGATRGDGITGEDITQNLRTIKSIPLKLREYKGMDIIEVYGEVYMSRENFKKLNEERMKRMENLFANPRNAAAGSVRQLDPATTASRQLDTFIYQATLPRKEYFATHMEVLNFLRAAGFRVNTNIKPCANIEQVIEYCNSWQKRKNELNYDIDGMVIKINQLSMREKLGSTTKSPRWAIAYKFPAEQMTTVVRDIIVGVGRTGALTPVALLEPVIVSGSKVQRATLHNEDEIKRKDIRIGDTVLIQKAGEVIPEIIQVIKEKRSGKEKIFRMPERCPVCGSQVVKLNEEVVSRCNNISCSAQVKERIRHFVSRSALDIEGLGPALINQLVDTKVIKDFADLYYLKREDLLNLERIAEKSSDNIIRAIEDSKNRPLSNLIYALGIRHVGVYASQLLAERIDNLSDLEKFTWEDFVNIEGIGPIMAESIILFFQQKENREIIKKLKQAGVNLSAEKKTAGKNLLEGLQFVLTGTLEHFTREEAKGIIERLGGRVASNVTKKTDFLLLGQDPGQKYQKAKELNIKIIAEEDFRKMIES